MTLSSLQQHPYPAKTRCDRRNRGQRQIVPIMMYKKTEPKNPKIKSKVVYFQKALVKHMKLRGTLLIPNWSRPSTHQIGGKTKQRQDVGGRSSCTWSTPVIKITSYLRWTSSSLTRTESRWEPLMDICFQHGLLYMRSWHKMVRMQN